jgi:hypothetical protein
MLSYSRGGLIAVGVGLAFWFAFVPLRLRGAIVLMGALAGAVPVTAWAFSMTGLSADDIPVAVRADAGHELGALLLLMSVVLFLAGLAAGFLAAESPPSPGAKRLAGRVLIGLLAIVPIVALLALHAAPGGIGGQVSKAWRVATDPSAGTPTNTPDRLTSTASVRARYWKEAFDIHASSPWLGTGAGAYATSRTRFRTGTLIVRHAHGYVPQTLADLGWVGMGLSLLALGGWGWAAAQATGLRRRDVGLPWDAERVGMAALVAVALVFGVSSAVDWTWFVPANAALGLLAAGWVAGRPPLRTRVLSDRASGRTPPPPTLVTAGGGLWAPAMQSGRRYDPPALADVAGPGATPPAEGRPAPSELPRRARRGGRARQRAGARGVVGGVPARPLGAGERRRDHAPRGRLPGRGRVRSPRSPASATRCRRTRSGSSRSSRSAGDGSRRPSSPSRRPCSCSRRARRPGGGSASSSSASCTTRRRRSAPSARRTTWIRPTRTRRRRSSPPAARPGSPRPPRRRRRRPRRRSSAPQAPAQPGGARDGPRHGRPHRLLAPCQHEAVLRAGDGGVEQLAREERRVGRGQQHRRGAELRALRLVHRHRVHRVHRGQARGREGDDLARAARTRRRRGPARWRPPRPCRRCRGGARGRSP